VKRERGRVYRIVSSRTESRRGVEKKERRRYRDRPRPRCHEVKKKKGERRGGGKEGGRHLSARFSFQLAESDPDMAENRECEENKGTNGRRSSPKKAAKKGREKKERKKKFLFSSALS